MKYSNDVVINLPLDKVTELLDNPENMKHWQPGLLSWELLTDKPGEVGSKIKLKYRMGKREIGMVETIVKKELPDHFDATYEAKGVYNIVSNRFQAVNENQTRWVAENEFQFTNLMMKIIGLLMPGSFKKQSQLYLDKFKKFAESR